MNLLEIFFGFLAGCVSSAAISLLWYKVLVPKIVFAESICKYDEEGCTYKIKFRNKGKRDIFEMYLYCILSLPDLVRKGTTHTADINLSYNFKPVLKKRGGKRKPGLDGLVRICMNDERMTEEFSRSIYPKDIQDKAAKKILTLEDLLKMKSGYLTFYIIAHDRFTGSKKIFESKSYTVDNIKTGCYNLGKLTIRSKSC